MTTRNGPTLAIVGDCAGCSHWRNFARDDACAHPDGKRDRIPDRAGTPAWCPRLSAARLALLADLARTVCRRCGATVEPERECYAVPTCYACLPPPPRMPVHTFGEIDESTIRTMVVGDRLSEFTAASGDAREGRVQ